MHTPNSKIPLRVMSAIFLCIALCSCEYIPGTKSNITKLGKEIASSQLLDPSSAQFRNMGVYESIACGEINGKNRMGSYVGFQRFYVATGSKVAFLDPNFDVNDLISANDLCSSMSGNAYSSASATSIACGRAGEQQLKQTLQKSFDDEWSATCEHAEK